MNEKKIENTIKWLVPIAVGATLVYALYKGKTGEIPTKQISDITKDVVMGSTKNANSVFGGLSQSLLDSVAKDTPRGIKAVVEGNALEYFYKSASGKTIKSASAIFDNAGNFICFLGNGSNYYSNSPRFFLEKVREIIQEV